ncbi:LacI family DNA-binding transcriptional regulator [Microbacterium testaceum]|uniref:LacI family DNA-binding transcriptional regulator n=1 Tax=Microbacterium testaceum TaxID=2033 RepID=UPI0012AC8E43|nr:substrate-binding domain-containing protein [Microbacterium testaceum]
MMTEFGHTKPAKNTLPVSTGPRSRTATIYDVAKIAGVSAQSVSRYVRGHTMRETTREKIEAALESVHYSPNLTARALISGKSQRIGLLVHGLDQIGPSRIVQGAAAASRAAGYVMDMVVVDMSDTTSINEAVLTLTDHGAAGIGALASTDEMLTVLNSASSAMPFVLAAEDEAGPHTNSSETSESGISAMVAHLVSLGHTEFLHVAGPPTWSAARNRRVAYEQAVRAHHVNSVGVLTGDWSARSGHSAIATSDLLSSATAIVCANDQMALGVMRAVFERGLRVPEDVSVTGIDDIPEAAYFSPTLTTVSVDFEAQGANLIARLLDELGDDGAPRQAIHRTSLVVHGRPVTRGSTGVVSQRVGSDRSL